MFLYRLAVQSQKLQNLSIHLFPLLCLFVRLLKIVQKCSLAVWNVLGFQVLNIYKNGWEGFALLRDDWAVEILRAVRVGQRLEKRHDV